METENKIGLRTAPFSRIDHAFFKRGQDVSAPHGNRSHTNVFVGLTGNAGRCAEAILPEIGHAVDGFLEPAQSFRAYRLQHQALDIHAHFFPELIVEGLSTAVHIP